MFLYRLCFSVYRQWREFSIQSVCNYWWVVASKQVVSGGCWLVVDRQLIKLQQLTPASTVRHYWDGQTGKPTHPRHTRTFTPISVGFFSATAAAGESIQPLLEAPSTLPSLPSPRRLVRTHWPQPSRAEPRARAEQLYKRQFCQQQQFMAKRRSVRRSSRRLNGFLAWSTMPVIWNLYSNYRLINYSLIS